MSSTVLKLLSFILLIHTSLGSCPNACSGHGTCDSQDSCVCFSNFQGGDCSQRVCQYHNAWVTSPNGDLNYNGDLYDSTPYSDDYYFSQAASYLTTDASPGGTWELWPSYHKGAYDEGHFYQECSNKGICDRSAGLCKCFPGYEGEACARRSCPNKCSGNGLCLSVDQLRVRHNADTGDTFVYNLWDKDMSRSCLCDPGFTGPDCSQRICPKGDDPLTTDFQNDAIQFIEIYSTKSKAAVTDSELLDGTATFTFKDSFGEVWITDPVDIQHYDGTTTAAQMATDLQAALEALPNDVIPSVSVSAGFCDQIVAGHFVDYEDITALTNDAATLLGSGFVRCPAMVDGSADSQGNIVYNIDTTSVFINGFTGGPAGYDTTAVGGAAAASDGSAVTCHKVTNPDCVRFSITFTNNPGNLDLMEVDVSSVTIAGMTNDQHGATYLAYSASKTLAVVDSTTADFSATVTPDETSDNNGIIRNSGNNKQIYLASPTDITLSFAADMKILVYCQPTGASEKKLGTYTVATEVAAGATYTIDVNEVLMQPNGECATDGSGVVRIVKVTKYIDTNIDFTNYALTGLPIEITGFTQTLSDTVSGVQYDSTTGIGQIFLTYGTNLVADEASSVGPLLINGVGTKENSECGDRGLCNRDSGICECFKGYTGDSCSLQNPLAV